MRLLLASQPETGGSALLRVLAGLSRADQGRVRIAGLAHPSASGWGSRVAYLGPEPGIWPWMTPREALDLAAGLLGLPADEARPRIERALAWVRIDAAAADRPVRRGGPPLLERTGFASSLIGDPEVLLLDEPLRAIDADERRQLLSLPGGRRTIVIASRYPASEAGLATHVALLRDGRLAFVAPVDELERAGLPLTMAGIAALGDARATARGDGPASATRAVATTR